MKKVGASATTQSTTDPVISADSSARPWCAKSPRRNASNSASTSPTALQMFISPRSLALPSNTSRTRSGKVTI